MYRLDGVDPEVRSYFSPVAKMVLASRNPQEAMEVSGCACGCWQGAHCSVVRLPRRLAALG